MCLIPLSSPRGIYYIYTVLVISSGSNGNGNSGNKFSFRLRIVSTVVMLTDDDSWVICHGV